MRLSCGYEELMSKIADVAVVSDNNLSDVSQRNVIFHFKKDKVNYLQFVGINLNVILKREFDEMGITVVFDETDTANESGDIYWQINCKELVNFLSAYKGLRKTQVSEVIFETMDDNLKIQCTVIESDRKKDDMDEHIRQLEGESIDESDINTYVSQWVFKNIGMKRTVIESISKSLDIPDGVEPYELSYANVLWHTSLVLPIMQNITSLYGNVIFDSEYLVGFSNAFTVFIKNNMCCDGIFQGIKLGYSTIAFLNKLCSGCSPDDVMLAYRTDMYICLKMTNTEVFLVYDTRLANYKVYIEMFKKDHVITFDRIYFKDMLKRFILTDDSIEFRVDLEHDRIQLSNSKFKQDLTINYKKGMEDYDKLKFKLLPEILNKAIIGVDETMLNMISGGENRDVYMYFCGQNKNNINFALSDGTGLWFAFINSRTY